MNVRGFLFTGPSKQQLMEGLSVEIQQHLIRYPNGVIVDELENFGYEFTRTGVRYSAPAGLHDDTVVALGLAVEQWKLMKLSSTGQYAMARTASYAPRKHA